MMNTPIAAFFGQKTPIPSDIHETTAGFVYAVIKFYINGHQFGKKQGVSVISHVSRA